MKQTHGNITCFFDENDVDEVVDDVLTGDEAEIAEIETRQEEIRAEKIKQIYLELGIVK